VTPVAFRVALFLALGASLGFAAARGGEKEKMEFKMANIVVTTTDMAKSVEFYETKLGLKSFFRNNTSCFLKAGGVNLVFVATTDKAKATKEVCLDFAVKDLPAAKQALVDAGVKVDATDPAILKFTDPDGNMVEVVHG
jgi:catechol 2,3-dioxygenase-like lactoylglutathione lyase family enzyme